MSFRLFPSSEQPSALAELERCLVAALLPDEANRQHEAGGISKQHLAEVAKSVIELSAAYVNEPSSKRGILRPSQAHAVAYALYYLPINFWKIRRLLLDVPAVYRAKTLSVLEFGCGPGTGILAAQSVFDASCTYTGIDGNPHMLDTAKRIQALCPWRSSGIRFLQGTSLPQESFDVVMAANVLSELDEGKALRLIEALYERLTPSGIMLIIEPGSRRVTRELMALRDLVLEQFDDLVPHFPCTRRDGCPMLRASGEDWCHGTLGWELPRVVRQIDELTDFNKHKTKFSAFVFLRNGRLREGYRAIAKANNGKRGTVIHLCGPTLYGEATLKKRNTTEENRALRKAEQYDLVGITRMQGLEIPEEARVTVQAFGKARPDGA